MADDAADLDPASRGPQNEISALLERIANGDETARGQLIVCLHEELRRIAVRMMRGQRKDHTLQATALVNELYVRIERNATCAWRDREHFLAYASTAMRCVLIEHKRKRDTEKRKATREDIDVDRILVEYEGRAIDLEALEEALREFESTDPKIASAIVARFYGGATAAEAAKMIGMSPRTFDREWKVARKWLYKEIR